MSIILPLGGGQQPLIGGLRAYSDPVIFRDDRVFKTLLRKEVKYLPASPDYFTIVQGQELKPLMRKEVASWMLEICEAEQCQPEVFCLAMNYLDRFLSLCKIAQSQLQLLASVCLLVACKVRQHRPLSATKLVEYSDFNLDVLNIMVSFGFERYILKYYIWKRRSEDEWTLICVNVVWFWLDSWNLDWTDKRQTAPLRYLTRTTRIKSL